MLAGSVLQPIEANAQYGGNILGGVLGGVIAGAIVANSRPHTVYVYPRQRRFVHYTRPAPRHYAARLKPTGATPTTTAINTSSDPFASAKGSAPLTVSNKP